MPTLVDPVEITSPSKWRAALARLDGAYSENTLRGYRSDFARFEAWCEATGQVALPASPETVATFIAHEARRRAEQGDPLRSAVPGGVGDDDDDRG